MKEQKIVKVKVNSLIKDYDLYPRTEIDSTHVGYMVEARKAGHVFPPIVIDKKSRRVADGFHRCTMELRIQGPEAEIDAIEKDYASDAEIALDSFRLNSEHGKTLNRHDRVHCWLMAKKYKISFEDVADALHMQIKQFKKLIEERMATERSTGDDLPLKRTISSNMKGRSLTKDQVAANDRLGGMSQQFYVNQVILLLETGMVDMANEKLLARLQVLKDTLDTFMAKIG